MKFGVREICDVVFKAKTSGNLGKYAYDVGQPVLYIDSAKTSTLEGAATTVYAQGGKGNSRLIAWEGEKTLTFTVEDALLSPAGFAILSGAGLLDASSNHKVYVHMTAIGNCSDGTIDLSGVLDEDITICSSQPVFVMTLDKDQSLTGDMLQGFSVDSTGRKLTDGSNTTKAGATFTSGPVLVDFYVEKESNVQELVIDAENFAGYYYVEASTLFRRQYDGKDLPAEIIFPNVKIQSNFTFNMAATGDPSTFTFTMDAMPGKIATAADNKKVLCAIQIVNDDLDNIEYNKTNDSITNNDI